MRLTLLQQLDKSKVIGCKIVAFDIVYETRIWKLETY